MPGHTFEDLLQLLSLHELSQLVRLQGPTKVDTLGNHTLKGFFIITLSYSCDSLELGAYPDIQSG